MCERARKGFGIGARAGTHELISDEFTHFRLRSSGGDHGPISFEYPLQLDVSFVGPLEHV